MRRPRPHLPACLALAVLGTTLPASAVAALPDLVSEPTGAPYVERYRDGRLLLRFDGYIMNAGGTGPLEIRASDPDPATDVMRSVSQWRDVSSPGVGGTAQAPPGGIAPTVVFEGNDDHNHYHLKDAAEYTLWTQDLGAQVAIAQKTEAGFCIEDSTPGGGRYDADANNFCWQDHRTGGQPALVTGISPGFRDVYGSWLSYQWIDISRVPPGRYRLGARVDPRNVIAEQDETGNNGYAFRPATVPGYRALPASAPQDGEPVEVRLDADRFGTTGRLRFRIVSAPAHGSLSRPVGADFAGSSVTYTPKPGYRGSDSFTYAAVDADSPYPIDPPAAAASLVGDTVSVAITGAPARLTAGTGVRLAATVVNATGGVTWSVGGPPGADVGAIAPDGLYLAPARPPPGRVVTVRATSAENPEAFGEARIEIAGQRAQAAAPLTACAKVPARREPARGSAGQVVRSARQLLVNQRISQAAVRRANAIESWLDAGVRARDLCGGAIGLAQLGPGVVAGEALAAASLSTADPRPLRVASSARPSPGRMTLGRRQLLINQRISQAAIRRLNGLARRLDGRLTGGDLEPRAVVAGKLAGDIRILRADLGVARPRASRTRVRAARRSGAQVSLTARQFRINQRIGQEAVRRANALADHVRAGLSARHFAQDTVVASNLAPALRP